jgi:spore coat polysaccharide biosynthesis protein SpsF
MGSSRLPGKVLADVGGVPALTRLLRRLRNCEKIDDVVLATSIAPGDDALEAWARDSGVAVYRGSEEDVLDRVVQAQRMMDADTVVEVTGDCPLLDPEVITLGIESYFANECDVVSNARVPSFPQGADVQVFRLRDLEHVAATISDPAVREHVSLYFYDNPDKYRIIHLIAPLSWQAPEQRLQLDYEEDLMFIRVVYARLEPRFSDKFGVPQVLALLASEPALRAINAHCVEKPPR